MKIRRHRLATILAVVVAVIAIAAIILWRIAGSETATIARDAYIYGYPIVTFDMARRQRTSVAAPDAEHAPMGQMIKMRSWQLETSAGSEGKLIDSGQYQLQPLYYIGESNEIHN